MKQNRKFLKSSIFFIFLLSFSFPAYTQDKVKEDSLMKTISSTENIISKIESTTLQKVILSIPYSDRPSKKIKVEVGSLNGIVRKLSYNSFDESMTTSGSEIYYFDTSGQLFSHTNFVTGQLMRENFLNSRVIIYSKTKKEIAQVDLLDSVTSAYVLASTKFIVDHYLAFFEGVSYKTFNVENNTSTILKTMAKIELMSSPGKNAFVLKTLAKGVSLRYLERSDFRDLVMPDKEKWVWLKVRDESNTVGWIWGHPSLIRHF